MSTERIDIVVSENGSRTVKRNLNEVGTAGASAAGGVNLLQKALAGLAVGAGLAFLVKQADAYTNLLNKLKLVTTGTANLTAVNDALFASANRTRSSYEETAGLFTTLSRASKSLGMSQQELLGITETVNQAIAISGTNASTAAAGLTQLGQAMGSGVLRGDELNSILENMPRLADAIAAGMGTTTDQLRKLGAEGKITSKQLADALKDQASVVAEEFNRMSPTVAGGITVVRNNLLKFIGDMDQALGISRTLANGLLFLGDNFQTLAVLTAGAGVALALWFGAGAIGSYLGPMLALQRALGGTSLMMNLFAVATKGAQGAMNAFTAAMARNPIGLVAVGIALAITALVAFGDKWKVTEDKAVSFLDVVMAGLSFVMDAVRVVGGVFADVWAVATDTASAAWDSFGGVIGTILGAVVKAVIQTGDLIIGTFVFAVRAIGVAWEGLIPALADIGVQAINGLIRLVQGGVNKIVGIVNELPGVDLQLADLGELNNANRGAAQRLGRNLAQAGADSYREYIVPAVTNVWDTLVQRARRNQAGQTAAGAISDTAGPASVRPGEGEDGSGRDGASSGQTRAQYLSEMARGWTDATDAAGFYNAELRDVFNQVTDISNHLEDNSWAPLSPDEQGAMESYLTDLKEANEVARIRDGIYQEFVGTGREYERHLKAANDLLSEGIINTEQYGRSVRNARYEMLSVRTDALAGFERGIIQVQDLMEDTAYAIEQTVTNAFRNAEDALVNFLDTGKLDVTQFIDDLWKDLARAQIREKVLGPIARMFKIDVPGMGAERGTPGNPMFVTQAGGALGGILGQGQDANAEDPTAGPLARVKDILGGVGEKLKGAWDGLLGGMDGIFKGGLSSLSGIFGSLGKGLGGIIGSLGKGIGSLFSGGGGGGGSIWGTIAGLAGSFFGGSFATGGGFTVPGSGGVDSQMVSLRATPGERVTVGRGGKGEGEGGGGDTYHFSIDARGAEAGVEEKVRQVMAEQAPALVAKARKAAVKDVMGSLTRERM